MNNQNATDGQRTAFNYPSNKLSAFGCAVTTWAVVLAAATTGFARGRSFPREVTGVITETDKSQAQFALAVDDPAETLQLAVGASCKFTHAGKPSTSQLSKGSRAAVSYYATVFTGRIAVAVDIDPVPKLARGIIEQVDMPARMISIQTSESSRRLSLRWTPTAEIVERGKRVSPAALRPQQCVSISYFAPSFGGKYATRLRIEPSS